MLKPQSMAKYMPLPEDAHALAAASDPSDNELSDDEPLPAAGATLVSPASPSFLPAVDPRFVQPTPSASSDADPLFAAVPPERGALSCRRTLLAQLCGNVIGRTEAWHETQVLQDAGAHRGRVFPACGAQMISTKILRRALAGTAILHQAGVLGLFIHFILFQIYIYVDAGDAARAAQVLTRGISFVRVSFLAIYSCGRTTRMCSTFLVPREVMHALEPCPHAYSLPTSARQSPTLLLLCSDPAAVHGAAQAPRRALSSRRSRTAGVRDPAARAGLGRRAFIPFPYPPSPPVSSHPSPPP
ncbi:hypothetical protein FB451DRAFT_1406511 [Mycena latifolia]|nr:hypothetical protein FB451DRAFT_1406511 [Mycena latifolia]